MSGKGFWDVVDEHTTEFVVLTVLAMWTARAMWSDWCGSSALENVVKAKLKIQEESTEESCTIRKTNEEETDQ
jgi:hypothetical protein